MLPEALQNVRIPDRVLDVLARLHQRGFQAYLVGGCVRDLLRGTAPKDYDVATSALPDQVRQTFEKVIPTGIQHGTVTVLSRGMPVEVTTFRSEGAYLDGRHPSTVSFETDIRADLSRRDFTINAIAFDPEARVLCDPFGGQEDLVARRIRCVGDASERFSEDGLRPLRAVRFAAVLGFDVDPETLAAIPPALTAFAKVSMERVREELSKLLLSDRAALGLELLRSTGMLKVFLPDLAVAAADWPRVTRIVASVASEIEQRLAALLLTLASRGREWISDLVLRLKFPRAVAEVVACRAVAAPDVAALTSESDADLRRFAAAVKAPNVAPILAIAEAAAMTPDATAAIQALRTRADQVLRVNPPLEARSLALHGKEIMEILGVGPSPAVGEATRYLLERVLDDPALNSAASLRELLRKWHAARSP